jgi:hypothetical protein
MDAADLFIIMGTETYGRQTSGIIDTYKEMQYIVSSKKPFFLFNMNPEPSLMFFQEGAANVVFNLSTVSWERWTVGAPMSPKVVDKIVQKLPDLHDCTAVPTRGGLTPTGGDKLQQAQQQQAHVLCTGANDQVTNPPNHQFYTVLRQWYSARVPDKFPDCGKVFKFSLRQIPGNETAGLTHLFQKLKKKYQPLGKFTAQDEQEIPQGSRERQEGGPEAAPPAPRRAPTTARTASSGRIKRRRW